MQKKKKKNCKFKILFMVFYVLRDFVKNNYNWLYIAQLGR